MNSALERSMVGSMINNFLNLSNYSILGFLGVVFTRIISASLIVDRRCATIKLVLPFIIVLNAFEIRISVRVSIEDVASKKSARQFRNGVTGHMAARRHNPRKYCDGQT